MRTLLTLTLVALVANAQEKKEEKPVNEEVVKAVRALVSERDDERRDRLLAELKARTDLDWASVRKGIQEGPYYQTPMITEFGERHSGKHFDERWSGHDGKLRGFSLYLPKSYDPKAAALPVLFYLHHGASSHEAGTKEAQAALIKFRDLCEKNGILFVAPYTSHGAEWWTPEGKRLVQWALRSVKARYSIDENRIALVGAMDGADSVWYLGQEMPGMWSCLMPMTGDPLDISASIRPLYLGTLDRMDVLMGVPGRTRSALGDANVNQYLRGLKPLFDQNMRITTAIYTTAHGDFSYLEKVEDQIGSWVVNKKRDPVAKEIDIETDAEEGLRCLWLESLGHDPDGDVAHGFKSTRLAWDAPKSEEPEKKLGVSLQPRDEWETGQVVTKAELGAREANILNGDVLLSVAGTEIKKGVDIKGALKDLPWDSDVLCVLAREVKESELKRQKKIHEAYMRKVRELREEKPGEPLPRKLWELTWQAVDSADLEDEEEEEGDTKIEYGGGDEDEEEGESEKTRFFVFERWVKLIRPEDRKIARADFGASWDPGHDKEGVKVVGVLPGGHAERCGLKNGDVIVQVGDTEVKRPADLRKFFEAFKFEKEPEGERFIEFTVKRPGAEGQFSEHTVKASWNPPKPYRLDARWDEKDGAIYVLARHVKAFHLYFADELVEPGKPFRLFINNVPYQDLVDPASAPDYPEVTVGSDALVRDDLERARRKRAEVEGWQPDIAWALDEALASRDRKLVVGARRTFDLTTMREGFKKAKERREGRAAKKGAEVKEAFDRHRAKE